MTTSHISIFILSLLVFNICSQNIHPLHPAFQFNNGYTPSFYPTSPMNQHQQNQYMNMLDFSRAKQLLTNEYMMLSHKLMMATSPAQRDVYSKMLKLCTNMMMGADRGSLNPQNEKIAVVLIPEHIFRRWSGVHPLSHLGMGMHGMIPHMGMGMGMHGLIPPMGMGMPGMISPMGMGMPGMIPHMGMGMPGMIPHMGMGMPGMFPHMGMGMPGMIPHMGMGMHGMFPLMGMNGMIPPMGIHGMVHSMLMPGMLQSNGLTSNAHPALALNPHSTSLAQIAGFHNPMQNMPFSMHSPFMYNSFGHGGIPFFKK